MKKNFFVIACIMLISSFSTAQTTTLNDSISNFYSEFISHLKSKYLKRGDIEWDEIESYVSKNAYQATSFEESLDVASQVFDSIKCNHCQLFTETGYYSSSLNKPLSQEDFNESLLVKYQEQPDFEVRLLNGNIGYIQIPGMLLIDLTRDSLNTVTQKMYDAVVQLAREENLEGWVVDLRFNIGGNVYPMLASLHYLLGDQIMYMEMDTNGKINQINRLSHGGFYSGDSLEVQTTVTMEPDLKIPVAIIVGKMTGSAGEDIAVAFKNRDNTVFIGENSYGFLTGNDLVELPHNIKFALTTCYIVDKNKVYREYIKPDIPVSKKDNFENFYLDENIRMAKEYFKNRSK